MAETIQFDKLERTSAADQLLQLVRQKILTGEFPPGSALPEVQLANSAGVSRNTLREAMRMLAAEGLVRRTMHCGVTVADLTDDDVTEIFRIRMLLELQAVATFVPSTNSDFTRFRTTIEKLKKASASGDWAEVVEQDLQFHRQIVSLLKSPRLEHFYGLLLSELRIALAILDRTHDKSARAMSNEHQAVLDLLISGKGESCVKILGDHLAEAEYRLREALRSRNRSRPKAKGPGSAASKEKRTT